MKLILSIAAAAIALTASPALADKGGHGNGNKEWKHGGDDQRDWRDGDRRYERNHNGYRSSYRNCPPGLARKHNGCMPPGQARKMARWSRGERVPYGYRTYTPYNQIPQRYVDQYDLDPNNRYIYRDNTIYQVDPRTQIIQQILGGLIR
ncbi:MAG: hypothetical protein ABIR77_00870 [Sphingomicrobium sp.]